MKLPENFKNRLKALMEEKDFNDFIKSYENTAHYGIRLNSLKISKETFEKEILKDVQPVPWCSTGYYYHKVDGSNRLSVHPYYHCGLYYFQEPSAMYPAVNLPVVPGDKVLDLCAAPGGKTTQLVEAMENKGFILANEISPKRAKALLKNVELMAVENTVVTSTTPAKLATFYGSYFDAVLVDAPCSGEGMFRKEKGLLKAYEKFGSENMEGLQKEILDSANLLLKPGGYLMYSTCTFSPAENEGTIQYLFNEYPDYEILELPKEDGISSGRPNWIKGDPALKNAARFWPHKVRGEGHFAILLRKSENGIKKTGNFKNKINWQPVEKIDETVKEFYKANIVKPLSGYFYEKDSHYYLMDYPYEINEKSHLDAIGLSIGEVTKYGFEPSQALIMTFLKKDLKHVLPVNMEVANRYLKGETLDYKGEKGYYGIFLENYPLGWAKVAPDFFKNKYPKSWRKSY
ncbi:hypothetical protein AZF37_02625 [endosymbiont 'TC1' of Trimyema compressum]|uniref:methyltransferase RsmF C-terminal domain-like protein n=1 Tax=endosymbiont 'TC1' of Trimyema compressum TaxID=243899 RepID=UPI0007F0C55B|nr:SAM-dependent methyltransferase [endosymbiont 'TC1' of Trimyema compressum]AMP20216.1 hypothetical protein AZF37_02625 [endosymbiont 'TC1' of Trimyema compressum]